MPNVSTGRLNGLDGMKTRSASELHAWADQLEAQATDPSSKDDPRWLRRWAGKIRRLAEAKERSVAHKELQK
jgi:hypothetical protein